MDRIQLVHKAFMFDRVIDRAGNTGGSVISIFQARLDRLHQRLMVIEEKLRNATGGGGRHHNGVVDSDSLREMQNEIESLKCDITKTDEQLKELFSMLFETVKYAYDYKDETV